MHSITQIDSQLLTAEIRRCIQDTSQRGLIAASKWLAELLLAIPASKRNTSLDLQNPPKWLTNEELEAEEREEDLLNVALRRMQSQQYHLIGKASHSLRNCVSAKARFIMTYSQFIATEKKALHKWHKSDNTRHQAPLPVNTAMNDLLESVQNSQDPWCQFLEALFLYHLVRIPEARVVLYRSLSVCPWNWSAWTLLGQCLNSSEELVDALTNIDLPLDHPLPQMFQIKIMNELHIATNAELQLCDKLLSDFFPGSLWLMGQRGRVLYDTSLFADAQAQFEKMLDLDSNRIEDLEVYSSVLRFLEKRAELTALAERFLHTNIDRPEVCCIVGNHYSLRADRDKAVKYFRRATYLDRTNLTAWALMGAEYHEIGNYPAAVDSYRKALDINKKESGAWIGLGCAYEAMGMAHYGLFYFQQAAKLRSNDFLVWEGMASCYEQLAKITDSLYALERALDSLSPLSPLKRRVDVRNKIARLSRLMGLSEAAVEQESEIIKMCDQELFGVNLKLSSPSRDGLVEQYLTAVYNVGEFNEQGDRNLKLAYDYYSWLMALGNSTAPRLKVYVVDQIKTKALLKGCHLTNADSPQFGYSLDYKEGRCLLLEFLKQQGANFD